MWSGPAQRGIGWRERAEREIRGTSCRGNCHTTDGAMAGQEERRPLSELPPAPSDLSGERLQGPVCLVNSDLLSLPLKRRPRSLLFVLILVSFTKTSRHSFFKMQWLR